MLLRTYKEGDEIELVRLFNEVYSRYAGFVPRTTEYWRWCCLLRPSVEKKGICVVEEAGKIVGYAVVSIRPGGPNLLGEVLEFCYHRNGGKTVVRELVKWILEYAISKNADSISLDAPIDDSLLRNTVEEFGFAEFSHVQPIMRIVDFPQLINEIATRRRSFLKDQNEVFLVNLPDSSSICTSSFTIQIGKNGINVQPGKIGVPSVRVDTDVATFTSCIFGVTSVFKEIFTLRLRVHPFWKLFKVAKLFSTLRLSDPWFIPLGDFG